MGENEVVVKIGDELFQFTSEGEKIFYKEMTGEIICWFVDDEFRITEEKWPLIIAEREKKGQPLSGRDLRKLFE